jgi:hypothetical protein
MAQTRKRRRRKHRGTQGGRIDSGRRRGRPQNRAEAQSRARSKRKRPARGENPPTWRGAAFRSVIVAAALVVVLIVLHRPPAAAVGLGAFMLLVYIPMGYYLDLILWRRRQRAKMRNG